jgi:hypothetical protein
MGLWFGFVFMIFVFLRFELGFDLNWDKKQEHVCAYVLNNIKGFSPALSQYLFTCEYRFLTI